MDLAKLITHLVNSGISERELAKLTDVRQSTINRIRNKRIANPSLNTSLKIVQVYKQQFGWSEK